MSYSNERIGDDAPQYDTKYEARKSKLSIKKNNWHTNFPFDKQSKHNAYTCITERFYRRAVYFDDVKKR